MKTENSGQTTVMLTRETKELLDKFVAHETKRTGYKIRISDIVARAVRELGNRITPVKSAQTKSVKVKKVKKGNRAGKPWTPAQKAKFQVTMAIKKAAKNNHQPVVDSIPGINDMENFIPDSGRENQ